MPKINLCFLWHMHQPLYKELGSGEYRLPWARLHALKDYFGMVKILEDFPQIHQTFNLVPSLLVQIEDYASGRASDAFLSLALKPAEELTPEEREFALQYFFQANHDRVIRRHPRYSELFLVLQQHGNSPRRAAAQFDTQMIRDLQVLSQLAWFDEYDLENDSEVRDLLHKGRNFSLDDQRLIGVKEQNAFARVIGIYREFAERDQIELSTSPFYHPILPLLCDSNIAGVAHPYISLPTQFAFPQDAEEQMIRARSYFDAKLGIVPRGLWPPEGGISEATVALAARAGFHWIASGEGVLTRTLGNEQGGTDAYQAYRWHDGHDQIDIVFRDKRLSELIGFVYSQMDAVEAARHFITELKRSCRPMLAAGHDALVPIILDGENAWETYFHNGRPFLRELYSRISEDPQISVLTISEALVPKARGELQHIFPGSWIDTDFDIWIGSQEDNAAWELLLQARNTYERATQVPVEAKAKAFEELLIAEGSDWCWWYGPEHYSANKAEFDQLFRDHLANVYRCLGEDVPAALLYPIAKVFVDQLHERPSGLIQPKVDGTISSRAEWANAGRYRLDPRSGAMHSQRSMVRELHYGSDGQNLYLRVDFAEPIFIDGRVQFELKLRTPTGRYVEVLASASQPGPCDVSSELPETAIQLAVAEIFEARISMSALQVKLGEPVHLRLAMSRDELPLATIPANGELELHSGDLAAYAY
ncbi:MAG: hypothetical protein JO061_15180 [Acidobacteriaceae bacterium]|nr:hypothetical protein [Acidobacteriaceae bacterium]